MTDALFTLEGERLVPTELARGPWDAGALHGGPTAAAVVWAAEHHLGDGWEIARLTLELVRPVPMQALLVATRTSRPGRKVRLVETTVSAGDGDGREVARSTVLAIRRADVGLGPVTARDIEPGGAATAAPEGAGGWRGFHNEAVEMRWVTGMFGEQGPATVWMRLRVPVVDGEDVSPAMRAAAVADFGNGVSSELDFAAWRFLNPELTVHLARPPVGEWVCLEARTVLGDAGAALATSVLSDRRGVFGQAAQSLLIERAGS